MSIRDELISDNEAFTIRQRLDKGESVSNEDKSAWERWDLWNNTPAYIYAYVGNDANKCQPTVTTWMGDIISYATFGRPYKSNFGDRRIPMATIIAGVRYNGTYYEGAGDYCRLRRAKHAS